MDDVKRKKMRQYTVAPVAMLAVIVGAGVFLSVAAAQDAPDSSTAVKSKKKTKVPASGERERPVEPSSSAKTPGAGASGSDSYPVPDWVYDARWYYIDVPRFHNGDKSKDSPGTSAEPRAETASSVVMKDIGGDIAGLHSRLPYLTALGVNAIILDGWDVDSVAVGTNVGQRIRKLCAAMHKASIRVVLRVRGEITAAYFVDDLLPLLAEGRHEGADGVMFDETFIRDGLRERSVKQIKALSREHVLLPPLEGIIGRQIVSLRSLDAFVVSWCASPRLKGLIARGDRTGTVAGIIDASLLLVFPPEGRPRASERLLSCFVSGDAKEGGAAGVQRPEERGYALGRLATALKHFLPGGPISYYGDEVGMYRSVPMWWNDLPDPKTKSPDYRGDFFALVQWLHKMRAEHRPLRRGGFRLILNDAENKIFSFARTLPGDEVILVMNYGDKKQKVMLPAGVPGQMVVAMTPMIDPSKSRLAKLTKGKYDHTKIAPLPVGGGRAFVNKEGKVRLWVAPMSIRVVLVNDKEPRR